MRVGILGTGSYLPEKVMTNDDLSKFVDTNDEWIRTRTGIRERRIAAENEATSDLAYKAAEKAIENAKIDKNEIDLVIVATMSPDHITPATAAIVQDKLGINAAAFDLSAACTGFVYAFTTGYSFVKSGIYKKVLVIGAETMSRILDWEDRTTCVLFGDGAGAVVLGQIENGGYIASHLVSDGSGAEDVIIPAGGSRNPVSKEEIDKREIYFKMKGSDVFKFAVRAFPETVENVLAQGNTTADDVDMFIPHQANIRIIESIAK